MTVYVLRLDPAMKHAKRYIGWTKSMDTLPLRFSFHCEGKGARMTAAAAAAGIRLTIEAVIPDGDRTLERQLKNQKNAGRIVDQIRRTGKIYGHAAYIYTD